MTCKLSPFVEDWLGLTGHYTSQERCIAICDALSPPPFYQKVQKIDSWATGRRTCFVYIIKNYVGSVAVNQTKDKFICKPRRNKISVFTLVQLEPDMRSWHPLIIYCIVVFSVVQCFRRLYNFFKLVWKLNIWQLRLLNSPWYSLSSKLGRRATYTDKLLIAGRTSGHNIPVEITETQKQDLTSNHKVIYRFIERISMMQFRFFPDWFDVVHHRKSSLTSSG